MNMKFNKVAANGEGLGNVSTSLAKVGGAQKLRC